MIWTVLFVSLVTISGLAGCPCGKRSSSSNNIRIVGGMLARQNAWPWTAALVYIGEGRNEQFCGSSVINDRYVLTAGHCVFDITSTNKPLREYRVLMGDTKLNGSNIVTYDIDEIKIHPNFDIQTLNFDIALVRLSRPILFNQFIRPICMEPKLRDGQLNGQTAVVVGWGAVRDGGQPVNSQREVRVRVVPTPSCQRKYAEARIQVTPNMICASSNNRDTCSGDSGGPLFLKRQRADIFDQIGIVSFGRRCAQRTFPGVYAKVSRLLNFVRENTRDARYC